MIRFTGAHLQALVNTASGSQIATARAEDYAQALTQAAALALITTPLRAAHFLAQVAFESNYFATFVENLRCTTPERLQSVFRRRRPMDIAKATELCRYGKETIGNYVYAGFNGNGDELSGDGYRYRGRGFIMLTGKNHYQGFTDWFQLHDAVADPDFLSLNATNAALSAAYFWSTRGINSWADADDVGMVTEKVNGTSRLGLIERKALLDRAKTLGLALEDAPLPAPPPPPPPALTPDPHYVYEQSTGRFLSPSGVLMCVGYSGHEAGLNNPAMEADQATGPIPRGLWRISLTPLTHTHVGILALALEPIGHDAHGRSAFRIHGDNSRHDQSASLGCIILAPQVRQKIIDGSVTLLGVVAG